MSNDSQLISLYLKLESPVDDSVVMDVAALLDDMGDDIISSSWEKTKSSDGLDGWLVMWVVRDFPPINRLAKMAGKITSLPITEDHFAWEPVPDVNWLEESYRSFPPLIIGSFFIYGSHYTDKLPKDKIPLQIDAATAFGSGEHGTTRGCLEALARLHKNGFKPKRILDMGSGSGILAIAAWKLWKKPVLAIDIDKEATRVAVHHRRINRVPSGDKALRCATGDGYKARQVRCEKGFDLIIANILAGPLVDMAPDLSCCLNKNGKAILSGLLIEQEDKVLSAHRACGLGRPSRLPRGEWQTLILNK